MLVVRTTEHKDVTSSDVLRIQYETGVSVGHVGPALWVSNTVTQLFFTISEVQIFNDIVNLNLIIVLQKIVLH